MLNSKNSMFILDISRPTRDESISCLSEVDCSVSRIYWWRWHIFLL